MSTVNLYDVLNVQNNCSLQEIKESYKKLVLKFHPDKKTGDPEMFDLVTHAFSILSNSKSRAEYDQIYKFSKTVDKSHNDLRAQSQKYLESQDSESIKKSKEECKKDFNMIFEELDKKHNYNRSDEKKKLPEKDAEDILDDLLQTREQDDIENLHDNLFEGGQFDISKFNEAFDTMHSAHNELVPHNGNPHAWNINDDTNLTFSSINNYENLYAENEDTNIGTSIYGSVKINNDPKKKLTKKDIEKIKGASYTKDFNKKEDNYNDIIKKRLEDRNKDTLKYKERTMMDYNNDDNCGGYGILHHLGIPLNSTSWDNDIDIKKIYTKLLETRNK